jgi:hypothetical protein
MKQVWAENDWIRTEWRRCKSKNLKENPLKKDRAVMKDICRAVEGPKHENTAKASGRKPNRS